MRKLHQRQAATFRLSHSVQPIIVSVRQFLVHTPEPPSTSAVYLGVVTDGLLSYAL